VIYSYLYPPQLRGGFSLKGLHMSKEDFDEMLVKAALAKWDKENAHWTDEQLVAFDKKKTEEYEAFKVKRTNALAPQMAENRKNWPTPEQIKTHREESFKDQMLELDAFINKLLQQHETPIPVSNRKKFIIAVSVAAAFTAVLAYIAFS